jgi:hypothetical protein
MHGPDDVPDRDGHHHALKSVGPQGCPHGTLGGPS